MIEVDREDFGQALKLAGMACERHPQCAILDHVRVAANGRMELAGTDLDLMIAASLDYSGEPAAPFLIGDHRTLGHVIGWANGECVTIAPGETNAFAAGDVRLRETVEAHPDDFPTSDLAMAEEAWAATLSPEHLRQIGRVWAAISTEETRYYLNGVYLEHLDGWTYRATATDGHRLMCVDLELPDAAGDLEPIIIPRRTIRAMRAALGKAEGGIRMRVGTSSIRNREDSTALERRRPGNRIDLAGSVGAIDIVLRSRTIDGHFPDYRRVFPQEAAHAALMKRADLRRAIGALTSGPRSVTPALKLTVAEDRLTIERLFGTSRLSARVEVPVRADVPAGGVTTGFNGRYLTQTLDALRGEDVLFAFTDSVDRDPTVIRDPADTACQAVMMPMRV